MKPKLTISATIEPNGLKFNTIDVQHVCEQIAEGTEVVLTVTKATKKRTLPQNDYYWAVIIPILRIEFNRMGNEVDDDSTHEFLIGRFIEKFPLFDQFGEKFGESNKRSKELSTAEFADYIDRIRAWSATFLGLYIPSPDDQFLNE